MNYYLITFSVFILYISYNYITLNDLHKSVPVYNNKHCESISHEELSSPENMVQLDKDHLITVSSSTTVINKLGIEHAKQSNIFLISLNNKEIHKLTITNYPKNVNFYAAGGIAVLNHSDNHKNNNNSNQLLYVINNAYKKGGQRVEVFEIILNNNDNNAQLTAQYKRHYKLDDAFLGRIQDISLISNDEFYISSYKSVSHNFDDAKENQFSKYSNNVLVNLFKVRNSIVFYCRLELVSNEIECNEVPSTYGLYNNGIAFIKNQWLYVSDSLGKVVREFKVDMNNKENVYLKRVINTDYAVDNIIYDREGDRLHFGMMGSMSDNYRERHVISSNNNSEDSSSEDNNNNSSNDNSNSNSVSGSGFMDLSDENEYMTTSVMQNEMRCSSSSFHYFKEVFISSCSDDKILVCKFIDQK